MAAEAAATEARPRCRRPRRWRMAAQINGLAAIAEAVAPPTYTAWRRSTPPGRLPSTPRRTTAEKVPSLRRRWRRRASFIAAVDEAQAAVDEVAAEIAEQQAIIDALADAESAVEDLEFKLETAKNADPVDEALERLARGGAAETAEAAVAEATTAADGAEKAIATLQEDRDGHRGLTEATEAARGHRHH